MKHFLILSLLFLGLIKFSFSQQFNNNIDQDSLFQIILQTIPAEEREEFKRQYEGSNTQTKEFLLVMLSLPKSSKAELIHNYEEKSAQIEALKARYSKLVPDSLRVSIEFNPADILLSTKESIDLKIFRKNPGKRNAFINQAWKLEKDSDQLTEMLQFLGWSNSTLAEIKVLLDAANCISIDNGKNTSVGFARSGMGKYSYLIFDKKLSQNEKDKFKDECLYIFYKDNIVLEYGGGAIGPMCFPD